MKIVSINLSKIAFVFLILTIISGGESVTLLSCQFQKVLKENLYFKHFITYILIFGLIMMEGGWELDNNITNSNFNWSNGNTLHSLVWSFVLYIIFLASTKMKFIYNIIFFIILLFIYIINTYKNNLIEKEILDKEFDKNNYYNYSLYFLTFCMIIILIIGNVEYFIYKKNQYDNRFNIIKYVFGINKCKKIKNK